MNKKKLFYELLYITLIFSLIIFMMWTVKFMKTNSAECMKDPVGYFEEKNIDDDTQCWCTKYGKEPYLGGEVRGKEEVEYLNVTEILSPLFD